MSTYHYGSIQPKSPLLKTPLTKEEKEILQADRPGYGTRNKLEVAFNLVNATVGAGIIGLPFAISQAGFFTGLLASMIVAVLAQMGLYMLILSGQRVGIYKFAMLVEYILGRPGYHFLNFIICVQAGGGCVSYFILLGDSLPTLFQRYLPQIPILANRTFILLFVGIFFIFPLSLSRSIGSLAKWSIISVLCLPVILLTILIRAPAYAPQESISFEWIGHDIWGALGIMSFAFTCHQVAFNNFLTLKDQTTPGWRHTTILSTGISWAISMTFAVIGYVCFGSSVKSNLFMNFATDDPVINIGRFALAVSLILTLPTGIFPTREAIQKSLGFETSKKQPTNTQHYAVTIVLFIIILSISIAVESLGTVYSLVGGFSATTLAYILPAVAYLVTRRVYLKRFNLPNTLFPTLTGATTITGEIDKKSLWETNSIASSSRLLDDDVSTVDGYVCEETELEPSRFLDIMAILLLIWGFLVMFFSISGALLT
ncbi:hypothetical protein G6F46_008486 [Rhizopus delemar]|uniref:Amino acid transporter transmembrane domain-containing protein n=3 Tax=Rhizopus TaxID=4842 RepID=I1BXS5_RHIO9|nr:hypothetical protein RO3G_05710 [Rhizopus delemar RA 99-880]KAG1055132.1 hypothetical protein G6F43_002902 [Rhizopus delemar]KAG1548597.1 hypothetical protein G6F51_003572 [Rhizopus arrhizus]KAG1461664.1 hypothetical protein G6F55_003434 [Rhizopus delemar]KAG1494165.1 hypothetical protein G6F54_008070 [Rhizopus delemar]|eukprot:EIE81005.1 hypothetical protein RO3G_05710 [Rhizopus delemar RA 99-880]